MEKEYIGARNRLLPMLIIVKDNKLGKESIMLTIPSAAQSLFMSFSTAFTQPTFQRILPLAIGGILTMGRRTVTGILWTMRGLIKGHFSTYHRVFSRAVWSLWPLGKVLAGAILRQIPPDEPVLVPMDDTTAQHRGKCVYGKGCHHDAVPFGSQACGLSLGTPLGRTGYLRKVPFYLAALGSAGIGGIVPSGAA